MPLVPALCTQCGAKLEVDNSQEAAICKSCGTPFVVEKAIKQYSTSITNNYTGATINVTNGDIDNYLKLAKHEIECTHGKEALEYAQKALEIDAECSEAWLLKLIANSILGGSKNDSPHLKEMFVCGNKALEYAGEKISYTEEKIYKSYMIKSLMLLDNAWRIAADVSSLKRDTTLFNAKEISEQDKNWIIISEALANEALKFKKAIPINYIESHQDLQNKLEEIIQIYKYYFEALIKRMQIYYHSATEFFIETHKRQFETLKNGLPEEKKSSLVLETQKSNSSASSENACYIATCIYGSYDCPQVWTLRRFRDYTLDETWYGRTFIRCYYTISPTLVKCFGKQKWFKTFWKNRLDKMVSKLNNQGIANDKYYDKY